MCARALLLLFTRARSVARTAAGKAAARPLARAENLGRLAVAVLGTHPECLPGRRTPKYPRLAPNSHVREIRAPEQGYPHGRCPRAADEKSVRQTRPPAAPPAPRRRAGRRDRASTQ